MKNLIDQLNIPIRVFDVHVHLGASPLMNKLNSNLEDNFERHLKQGSPENILKIMETNVIDKAIISPHPGYFQANGIMDTIRLNNLIASTIEKYPEQFPCGLGTVEPLHGERSLQEVKRIIMSLGLQGIMLCTRFQGILLDSPIVFKIFQKVREYQIIALVETCGSNMEPWRLAKLAEEFPEITFINAHPGLTTSDFDQSLWLAQKYDNIYLDTCQWSACGFPYRKAVNAIGADRILFGDDIPYIDTSFDLIHTKLAEISDEDKELILWKNASRIFNIKS